MAQDVNLAVRIATVLDAAGLNKAGKSVDGFDKKLKTLGRTLGVTLSGAAIAAFFAAEGRASPDPAPTNDPAFILPVTHIE